MTCSLTQRLGLLLAFLLVAAPCASAQTTFTVCAVGCGFTTIQAGVDAASDGDDVLVLNGTYTENVVVDSKDITVRSKGSRDDTTIEGISNAGALGTLVVQGTTTGFTLDGFTVIGIDNGNPASENAAVYVRGTHTDLMILNNEIQANGDEGFLAQFAARMTDPVLDNNLFTGQAFVGTPSGNGFSDQFTQPNRPRQLVVLGNGGGDAASANVTGLVFTNNEVTGTAGGINDLGEEQGNSLTTLDAANATITDNLFAGTTTRFGSQLRVRRPGATITDNTFESDGLGAITSHVFIENNGTPLPMIAADNTFDRGAYAELGLAITVSVNPSVFGAASGDTVNIFPASYSEQLFVDGKTLTIDGADADSTTIIAPDAPATLADCFGSSQAVVCATSDADLTLQNVTVDGNGRGEAGSLIGVALFQSSGTVRNTIVQAVRDTPANGVQRGLAIFADNFDEGGPYTVSVEDNVVRDFQKNGITVGGLGVTATVTGNTVLGEGPVDYIAQNGIQFAFGAVGTITDNTISGISFDPVPANEGNDFFDAAGIILSLGSDTPVTVQDNTITGSEAGILADDAPSLIQGNTITSSAAASGDDDYTGIYLDTFGGTVGAARHGTQTHRAQPALLGRSGAVAGFGRAGTVAYEVRNNTITGGGDTPADTNGVGLFAYAFANDGTNLDLTAENNTINGFDTGVFICEDEDGLVLPVDLDGFNDLSGNSPLALEECISNDIDAEDNFWGPTTASAIAALIEEDGNGEVDFVPFIGSSFQVDLEANAASSLTVQQGGSVSFQYTIENNNAGPVRGDLYFVAERASDSLRVASGRIASGTVPGGATLMGNFNQNVPNNAPPGTYIYRLRVGQSPNTVVDVVVFRVTVQSNGGRTGGIDTWSVTDVSPWLTAEEFAAAQAAAEAGDLPAAASTALPTEFAVSSAPNPATHRATLGLAVPEAGPVTVTVYDVRGRMVALPLDRELEAGHHSVDLDVAGLASGVYIVRAQSASRVAVRRITVVR